MRGDLVAPPLEPRRRRHAEAVDVEDAAAHAELGDLGDGRHPAVSHRLERAGPRRSGGRRSPTASRSRSRSSAAGTRVRSAVARAVVTRMPEPALQQRLDRLGPLAGDLVVRLVLAQRLALGIERRRPRRSGARGRVSQRSASPGSGATTMSSRCGKRSRQPGREHRPARPRQPAEPERVAPAPEAARPDPNAAGARAKASSTGLRLIGSPPPDARERPSRPARTAAPAQSSGPRRSPRAAPENTASPASSSDTTARPVPESPHLGVGGGGEPRLARIDVARDGADRVAPADEEVERRARAGRNTPPPSTRQSPLALPHVGDEVGKRHRIARRAVVQRHLAARQPVEQQVHERHEPGRDRQVGPRRIEPAAEQHDVAAAHDPGRAGRRWRARRCGRSRRSAARSAAAPARGRPRRRCRWSRARSRGAP